MTKAIKFFLLILCLIISSCCWAEDINSVSIGQTLQIYTHFTSLRGGKPLWLLILRDVETGQVLPYLFDVEHKNNFWIAFSTTHAYRVTASTLKFGACAVIHNFCHLENGILNGKSMVITLSGTLSPNPSSSNCHVLKYSDAAFTIVGSE